MGHPLCADTTRLQQLASQAVVNVAHRQYTPPFRRPIHPNKPRHGCPVGLYVGNVGKTRVFSGKDGVQQHTKRFGAQSSFS